MAQTLLINATIPTGVRATYQWLNDGVAISGATRTSYVLKATDVSHNISSKVTLTRTAYNTLVLTTDSVPIVAGTQIKQPTLGISGTTQLGKTITGLIGSWDSGVKLSYQWYRDSSVISTAIAKSYKLTVADVGHTLTFRVTAVKPGYITVITTSAPTGVITN